MTHLQQFRQDINEGRYAEARELIANERPSAMRTGMEALYLYAVDDDCEKAFAKALDGYGQEDGTAAYTLGLMIANADTPDQRTGGDRQQFDEYDAPGFMEAAARSDSPFAEDAHLWLGDYFIDSARGGDPDEAIDNYKAIVKTNITAAERLVEYYWDRAYYADYEGDNSELFDSVVNAVELAPADFSYEMAWLYNEGIGCERDFRMARKYLEDAYAMGDERAPELLSEIWQERADDTTLDSSERDLCRAQAKLWQSRRAK